MTPENDPLAASEIPAAEPEEEEEVDQYENDLQTNQPENMTQHDNPVKIPFAFR